MKRNNNWTSSAKGRTYLLLSALVGVGYLSVYLNHFEMTALFGWLFLVLCYIVLIRYNNIAPVLFLICSNKVLCGFLLGPSGFSYVSALVNYIPICFFLVRNISPSLLTSNLNTYKYTFCYLIILAIYFVFNMSVAMPLFIRHVFPYVLIVLSLTVIPTEIIALEVKPIQFFFRAAFLVSFVAFLLPGHIETEGTLLTGGYLFGQETEDTGFALMDAFRNVGIFFDPRVTGLFACVYFFLLVKAYNKVPFFDICLVVAVVLTSISRGAMMILVLLILFYRRFNARQIIILSALACFAVLFVISLGRDNDTIRTVLMTMDLTSDNNVLSQRSFFKDYSLSYFYSHPLLGAGFGELNAPGLHRNITSEYDVVTDAYLYAKLGEMGILGALLFSLSFVEMIKDKKCWISYGLLVGLFLQMLGTDTPNMGFLYFVMLILVSNKTNYVVT